MKKIVIILLLCSLVFSGIHAVALSDDVDVRASDSLFFSKPQLLSMDQSISVEIPEASEQFIKHNHYMVPMRTETYTFPQGTQIDDVVCTPQFIRSEKISKPLAISPTPVLMNQQYDLSEDSSSSISETLALDIWYDYNVGVGITGSSREVIVTVEYYPVQYIPSENEIRYAESFTLDIKHHYTQPTPEVLQDEFALIVLAPVEFTDELAPLITHKNNRGLNTTLVTLQEIYNGEYFPVEGRDDQEKIKYFIKNAIEQWGTSYVLLVGGDNDFPARTTHVEANSNDDELFVSDLYYADIYNETFDFCTWDSNENDIFGEYNWGSQQLTDDVDLYPDVYLGRLACLGESQVTSVVNKIITYETNRAYTEEWFTNILGVGGDSFTNDPAYGDESGVNEGEFVNEEVFKVMDGFIPTRLWVSNGVLTSLAPTGVSRITSAVEDGAGFIDFSGHGNPQVYATHPHNSSKNVWVPTPAGKFDYNHVLSLSNGDKLPIVVTGACSVAKYNQFGNCFSWAWVANPNGGSIGSFGATGLGWAYISDDVTKGLVEGMALNVFKAYKEEGATTLGEMWAKAIENYIGPGLEGVDYKTIEEWQPFCDPSLAVAEESEAPFVPQDLAGPAEGRINQEHTYSASTTDPEGDELYYLFDWGDGEFSGWVGPFSSGEMGEATHTWTERGSYEIRVKAKDDHGVQSDWSDPLPISMPLNNQVTRPILMHILEQLCERFPIVEAFLESRPLLNALK